MKSLPTGIMNFRELITQNYYFCDKTLMIADFIQSGTKVTLITRPRRFGKTLNMSMLAEFLDITKDSKDLFKDTKIMNTAYISHMNQYPVIYLTFADAKKSRINAVRQIKLQIRSVFLQYMSILEKNLNIFDQEDYKNYIEALKKKDDGDLDSIVNSLVFLMEKLETHYNKKVMLFIDEYDTPFIEGHVHKFYDDINNELASLLHNTLKTSTHLKQALLTGIQRVAKENIFSDLNNPIVCTVADEPYAQYFGFTEEETKDILDYYHLEFNDEVKNMYDGYRFSHVEIYNPWSILNYIYFKSLNPYWLNTASNTMIKEAIAKCDSTFNNDYESLIKNGHVEVIVDMNTTFYELATPESLWGLLLNAGYLTIQKIVSQKESRYILKIPNQEVLEGFKKLTISYLAYLKH